MELCSDYTQFSGEAGVLSRGDLEEKSVDNLFCDFYTERSGGVPPTDEDAALLGFAGEILQHAEPHAAPTAAEIEKLLDYLTGQEART